MKDIEEWKRIIIDNEITFYEISNKGRCRNLKNIKNKNQGVLTPKYNKHNGRYTYCIRLKGKLYYKYRYRLVAEAFIPNVYNKPEVNHIDGDKTNDIVENLEWVTGKENMNHAFRNELYSTATPVSVYTLKGEFVNSYDSVSEAIRQLFPNHCCKFKNIDSNDLKQEKDNIYCNSLGYQWRLRDNDIREVIDIKDICSRQNIPIVKLSMENQLIDIYTQIHQAYVDMNKKDNGGYFSSM